MTGWALSNQLKTSIEQEIGRGGSVVKNLLVSAGDVGSVPGWGKSAGGGQGNPLQYSCLENPMDRGASVQFISVTQSCPTLCDPMNRSMPGLPVLPQYKIKKFKVWGEKKFCPGKPAQPVSTGSVPRSVPSPEH